MKPSRTLWGSWTQKPFCVPFPEFQRTVQTVAYQVREEQPRNNSVAWRRQWHPTPALLFGKSHGRRSMLGCNPWGHKEFDTTEQLTHFHVHCHPTTSSSVVPFSSCPQFFPASRSLQGVSYSHQVAKVLELQLQHQSFQ